MKEVQTPKRRVAQGVQTPESIAVCEQSNTKKKCVSFDEELFQWLQIY